MTFWEVILLVTGFACLCASYFIARSRDTSGEEYQDFQSSSAVWTEKEEEMIRNRVAKLLEEHQTELVDKTTEELNHLCNDKIIAVDEFSRPLLEKIENNHQEVVFMYNMLNEKEKEIKKILSESVMKEKGKAEEQDTRKEKPAQEVTRKAVLAQKIPAPKNPVQKPVVPPSPKAVQKGAASKPGQIKKTMPDGRSMDVNALIQKMYKEGKSVMEISKALNIGQGEVKLVITLYGGRAR